MDGQTSQAIDLIQRCQIHSSERAKPDISCCTFIQVTLDVTLAKAVRHIADLGDILANHGGIAVLVWPLVVVAPIVLQSIQLCHSRSLSYCRYCRLDDLMVGIVVVIALIRCATKLPQ